MHKPPREIPKPIQIFCERLRQTLLHGGSINDEKRQLWTHKNFRNLHDALVLNPLRGPDSFINKILQQIKDAKKTIKEKSDDKRDISEHEHAELIPLMLELLSVYYVFPSNVRRSKKRSELKYLLEHSGDIAKELSLPLDKRDLSLESFEISLDAIKAGGVGSGGMGYNTNKWREVYYLKSVFKDWYGLKKDSERQALLSSDKGNFKFQDFLDKVADRRSPQCRHALLYLLFPKYYAPIISSTHKRKITQVFSAFCKEELVHKEWSDDEPDDLTDQKIKVISAALAAARGKDTDFYDEDILLFWDSSSEEIIPGLDIELLEHKKQIVLYGPPGTSKTYTAKRLAKDIIKYRLAQDMGTSILKDDKGRLKQATEANVHILQLHPAYSYEDFIRGLQIKDGDTSHKDGYLLRLLDDMKKDSDLPHVLVLDELNRVDLSRLFGECFSALENRGEPVDLLNSSEDGNRYQLVIPDNLYIIGTMNLIDHSVEQLDFALRRRFLWVPASYNPDALLEICRAEWDALKWQGKGFDWEKVESNFEQLVDAANKLNDAVCKEPELGEDFVLGHAFFIESIPFSHQFLQSRSQTPKRFLFTKNGSWCDPIEKLWRLSLCPLLKEYLSGLDNKSQRRIMDSLKESFKPYADV